MLSSSTDSNGVVRLRSCNEESTNNVEEDGKEVLFDTGARLSNRTSRVFT